MVIKRISDRNYQLVMDPSTARYIMDYLYFARDVEPVWYYKKVSSPRTNDRKGNFKLILSFRVDNTNIFKVLLCGTLSSHKI